MNKVGKDELFDFNSLIKHCLKDRKASMSAQTETLLSCSLETELAENNTQNLIL